MKKKIYLFSFTMRGPNCFCCTPECGFTLDFLKLALHGEDVTTSGAVNFICNVLSFLADAAKYYRPGL